MRELAIDVEWDEPASWVRSPLLAATWGKLEIRAGDRLITQFWNTPSNSVRTGVHVSVLPLASWIVRNWWNLLHERTPAPEVLSGARQSAATQRAWLLRHSLFLSREGMAYPDLSIYREDQQVGLRWVADPEGVTTAGRFLDSGFHRIDVKHAEAELARFVDAAIERLDGLEDPDALQLRNDWHAIQQSRVDEPRLCKRLGELGLDPYAAEGDESVESVLTASEVEALSEPVLDDLLASTTADRVQQDLADLGLFVEQLQTHSPRRESPSREAQTDELVAQLAGHESPDVWHHLPYRAGYARARALRSWQQLSPFRPEDRDPARIAHAVGPVKQSSIKRREGRVVEAVVERNGALAVAAEERDARGRRFLLARALHHWLFVDSAAHGPRLLTRGSDWQQAASRAFAAELLAPAEALGRRLERAQVDWDADAKLADEFDVSPRVIVHQRDNHQLA